MNKNKKLQLGLVIFFVFTVAILLVVNLQLSKRQKAVPRASEPIFLTPFVTLMPEADIPVYPGSELVSASALNNATKQAFVWQVQAETQAIIDYMQNTLGATGWVIADAASVITAYKDSRTLTISVTGGQTGSEPTSISATVETALTNNF